MVLVKWDPWSEMLSAQREAHDMLRRYFGDWSGTGSAFGTGRGSFAPPVEVFSRNGDLVVRAELPGIDPEKDVDITLHDNVLTISGERRREEQENGDHYFRSETHYGAFERRLAIPEGTKAEDITASYKDGILEVVVPKGAVSEPTKIPVVTGGERKALLAKGRKK